MKCYVKVGYSIPTETAPDVVRDVVQERSYSGDVTRNYQRNQEQSNSTVDNVVLSNQISIVADPFAYSNFSTIKYVEWLGQKWKVTAVEIAYPRLLLSFGGAWNGPVGSN